MNRYALFFVLLTANIALPNPESANIEGQRERHEALKKEVSEEFGKRFHFLIMKNLDEQQCNDAMIVKDACNKFLTELLYLKRQFPGEPNIFKEIKEAPGRCIANFAQNKKEYEYKKNTPSQIYSRKIEQEAGQEAYEKAFNEYKLGINLSYLFNTSPAKVSAIFRGDRDHIPYEYVFY